MEFSSIRNGGVGDIMMARVLSYDGMRGYWRAGLRNGNWRSLSVEDRAMYLAGLEFTRVNREVRNTNIVARILSIVEKLKATVRTMLMKVGSAKAREMISRYSERDVFNWLPKLRVWLGSRDYMMWLGTLQITIEAFPDRG